MIALYSVLHFVADGSVTLCFDEPDNFLALREIQPWLAEVIARTDAQSDTQVLLISHHPEVIDCLRGGCAAVPQRRIRPFAR